MVKNRIPEIAREHLSGHLDKSGSVLYSSHDTLKRGSVYFMGFNPGGTIGTPLSHSIDSMLTNEKNLYLDEAWKNEVKAYAIGQNPLQLKVKWIMEALNLNLREVCASNLIFIKSRSVADINFDLANRCWPVHEAILDIVQPKLILAFGNSSISPYEYMKKRFSTSNEMSLPSGHGNWKAKGVRTTINGRDSYVVGLPHLSRYSPMYKADEDSEVKRNMIQWLRSKL